MNDNQRRATLHDAAVMLTRLSFAIGRVNYLDGKTVLDRMRDAAPGLRAAAYDGDRAPVGGVSDPTGRQAVNRKDREAHVLAELDRLLTGLQRDADRVRVILGAYGPPRAATAADKAALAKENAREEAVCESCARTEVTRGIARGVEPYTVEPSDVGGRLPEKMHLCRWCWDAVVVLERLPSKRQVQDHHDGKRVKLLVVDPKCPGRSPAA